ncbi:MAG: AbrB/MazE/SpoVT family DNA-binding domain-containing protein [Nitrososphaerota archaeon]
MEKRKVMKVGTGLAIVIPALLAKTMGLQKGSEVYIDFKKNGEAAIIIRPVKQAAGEGEAEGR